MDADTAIDCSQRAAGVAMGRLDPVARSLTGSRGVVHLTQLEALVLQLLARGEGPCSREYIYHKVFGRDWCPTDRSLDVHVAHLRRKLGAAGLAPPLIDSIRSRGYRLRAPVCVENTSR